MAEKKKTTAARKTVAPKRAATAKKIDPSAENAAIAEELYDEVARRAYARFAARGYEHGHDLEDWLAAEAEL
jgi:hypothetical protein